MTAASNGAVDLLVGPQREPVAQEIEADLVGVAYVMSPR